MTILASFYVTAIIRDFLHVCMCFPRSEEKATFLDIADFLGSVYNEDRHQIRLRNRETLTARVSRGLG